ncbi:uncharacterized protein LOC128722660 [Anopheles nili]|uniref:uncharacterized protein LOC128722660 n=1 Tax=Anopheles nili TaxID=185578 RepID=UPI00237AE870|nr:uncharacterized protein LOC128722660 [Anopheles nili]
MDICCTLLVASLGSSLLAFGGTSHRRWRFVARELLILAVLIAGWQSVPVQGASPWRKASSDSEESYYEVEDTDDGEYKHGVDTVGDHDDDESVEIEFEEHDHHSSNGVRGHILSEDHEVDNDDDEEEVDNGHSGLISQLINFQQKQEQGKRFNHDGGVVPPVTIAVPYPVHVEKKIPVFIEKKVPVYVEKKVEVPVDRPYEVPVPVRVHEKEVIHVPKPVVFNVDRPYPVFVHRTVFVEKYRPFKVLIKSRTRY